MCNNVLGRFIMHEKCSYSRFLPLFIYNLQVFCVLRDIIK